MKGQGAKWLLIPLTLISVAFGCTIPAYIRYRLERMATDLPQPEGVELLAQTIGNRSGSDCIAFSYYWIYGPKMPLEEIFNNYRDALLKNGWKELQIDKSTLPPKFQETQLGTFQREDYLLIIDRVEAQDAILFSGLHNQKSYLESKSMEYDYLLMITLSLSERCPEAQSE